VLFDRDKIILDLCGGTGSWSRPYREAGYDVRLITLPEHNVIDYIPPKNVYGILAAPPCTEFSLARNGHPNIARDFIEGLGPVNSCIRIVWQCNPVFWALENPVGLLSNFLGRARYIFHPWFFGDPWTKRTALWGRFNIPICKYNKKTDVMTKDEIIRSSENRRHRDSGTAQEKVFKRAITPPGFAKAFFRANK
jgi:hypothetical protein